jgi:hypothetical protein
VPTFLGWTQTAREQGLVRGDGTVVADFTGPAPAAGPSQRRGGGEYPPLALAILHAARALGEAAGLAPLWSHKAALLAAHWTAVAMLLAASRSLLLAAGFSAAVLLDGGALGYLDLFLTPWQIGAATEPP